MYICIYKNACWALSPRRCCTNKKTRSPSAQPAAVFFSPRNASAHKALRAGGLPCPPPSSLPSLLPVPTSPSPRHYISLLLPIPIPTCHHPLKSTPTYPNGSLPPSTHPFQPLLYLPICTHFLKGISCSLLGTNTGYYILEKRNCIKILFFFFSFSIKVGAPLSSMASASNWTKWRCPQ